MLALDLHVVVAALSNLAEQLRGRSIDVQSVLRKHVGRQIGLNVKRPFHIETVELVAVEDDYFSVSAEAQADVHHIPYANIVRIIENPNGVQVGGFFHQKKTYPLIVKIGHIVEYVPA